MSEEPNPAAPENHRGWSAWREGVGDYLSKLRLFSRNTRLYLLGSFLMGINFQVFLVLLNLYLREGGWSEGDIGLVSSARAVGMTLMAIPAGIIMARIMLKPMLIISCVFFAIFSFGIVDFEGFGLVIGCGLLSGMAFSIYRVAAGPFFMRNTSKQERTYVFSASFGTNMIAGIIGAAGAGRLAAWIGERTGDLALGYEYTLYAGIAVSLLSLAPFALIRSSKPKANERRIHLTREMMRTRGPFFFKIFFSNFLVGVGAGLIIPFLNLYFRDRFDLQPDSIGFYYALVHLSMLAGSMAGPVLAKHLGLVRTVVLTQLVSLPFMMVLSYTYLLPLAAVAFIARGGLMNLGIPLVTNLGMELAQENEQALVGALLMVGWTSSWMISTAVGGHLIEAYGYTVTMNITIAVYALASLTFFLFFRGTEKKQTDGPGWVVVTGSTR